MIRIHDEVAAALNEGRPVVALESAVITAGLPREPVSLSQRLNIAGWRADQPANLELGRAMELSVRDHGAIPATVAVIDGELHIGLSAEHLERLALDHRAGKAAATDLAHALAQRATFAGTTVSGTLASLAAARRHLAQSSSPLASSSPPFPLPVFATGGIGGVHRDWQKSLDMSADLAAIASTPACIVCSGGKSILDLPATVEALEALNVPVLGYQTHLFPQFQSLGTTNLRVRLRVESAAEAAGVCRVHWETLQRSSSVVLAQSVPEAFAVDAVEITLAVEAAEAAARKKGVIGALRTPFLLNEIARLTNHRSLDANLALLVSNAALAAQVAIELASAR